MLNAYVCRQCRVRIARRTAPPQTSQWQPRATFISFAGRKPQETAHEQQEGDKEGARQGPRIRRMPQRQGRESSQQLDASHRHGPSEGPPRTHTYGYEQRPLRRGSRYSNLVDAPAVGEESHAQEAIQAAVEEAALASEPSYAMPIQAALQPGHRDIVTAWALFNKTYTSKDCEALANPPPADMALLSEGKVFRHLLHTVNIAFCNGYKTLPVTPTKLMFRYEQLGIARPEFWTRETLAYLTHQAIESVNSVDGQRQQHLPDLLHELVSVWRLFFQCKGPHQESLKSISTMWHLPALESMPDEYETKNFGFRLNKYHPKFTGNPTLGFCAVYLYSISDALKAVDSLHQEAAPLLLFFERLLAGSHVQSVYRHTEYYTPYKSLSPDVQQQIMGEIDGAPSRALLKMKTGSENPGDEAANREAFFLARIARAVKQKTSSVTLEDLWEQAILAYTPQGQKTAIPPRVYNAFLSGFMILLKSPRSVEIWNHMIAHGVQPTILTWVALLNGCANARDLDGLNAMWQRMLASGIEPDEYAWTTRVNGLFTLRQINSGLAALDEMGRKWRAAEEAGEAAPQVKIRGRPMSTPKTKSTPLNTVAKPSIEVINGAITAIVKIRRDGMGHDKRLGLVQKILGWAGNFGISPNAITYNTLIRLYLDTGDYTTASKILRQMEVDGIPSDAATHSMLMSVAFDNERFDDMSASQQTSKILSHLDDIEASGIKLNDYIYHTAVDRLLKYHSNYDAVRAIVEHMSARMIVPSPAIYTSLATHYFQQNPPNIMAVDGLVHQIFTHHRVPSDVMLFDRLIEGYANVGEVGKMMSVLTRMSKHGKPPGWRALTAVLRALAEQGDYERARSIVSDITKVKGIAVGGITGGNSGEFAFFKMVKELDLGVDEEMMGERADFGPLKGRVGDMVDESEAGFDMPTAERRDEFMPGDIEPPVQDRRLPATITNEQAPTGNLIMPVTPRTKDSDPPQPAKPLSQNPEVRTSEQETEVQLPVRTRIVDENPPQAAAPAEPAGKEPVSLDDQDVHGFLTDEQEQEPEERRRA
ncbi:hypothetical protein NX059_010132 [Plenodomus lindquistii]|nr:hypothetical protein NX059_010132 [Plenodomus lindquistii]